MMKWLRQHNKKIMAGVVLFAMLSFVGGQALYDLLGVNPNKLMVLQVFDQKISLAELNVAEKETQILDGMFIPWAGAAAGDLGPRHWVMLVKEAERAGVNISEADVNDFLEQREQVLLQAGQGSITDIRKRIGLSMAGVRSAVARWMMVQRNFERVRLASLPSEPQVRHYVQATEDKIQIAFASLDAEQFIDFDEPITEEEIAAQFQKYRDVLQSESEDGFGYKHPRRVRLQYVSASVSKINAQTDVSLDEIKNHWKANESKYLKSITVEEPVPPDPAATQPAEQPEMRTITKQVPKSFSEARDEIAVELRERKANRLARQVINRLADEMIRPWNEVKTDPETGFKPIPPVVEDPEYMQTAMAQVSARFGVTLDYTETPLMTAEQVRDDFNLRGAETPGDADEPLRIQDFAFRVPEFYKPEGETDTSLRLQRFQTPVVPLTIAGRYTFEMRGNQLVPKAGEPTSFILFRVVEVHDSEPPASLDEVRAQVERDIRLKKAYERIEPIARELSAVASRVGIDVALTYFDDLRTQRGVRSAATPPAFARMTRVTDPKQRESLLRSNQPLLKHTDVPSIGASKAFIDACFDMTSDAWTSPILDVPQTSAVQAATTQPAASPPPKVRHIPLPAQRKWVVVELIRHTPVDINKYETDKRKLAFQMLAGDRGMAAQLAWYDRSSVESRCKFVELDPDAVQRAMQGIRSKPTAPFVY